MFDLEKPISPNVLVIHFDEWRSFNVLGPFFDILDGYSEETGLHFKTVDFLYNYKFVEDNYKIQFYWNEYNRIFVFDITKAQYELIYSRLNKICELLNRRLAERKYFEKYGELPNHGKGLK